MLFHRASLSKATAIRRVCFSNVQINHCDSFFQEIPEQLEEPVHEANPIAKHKKQIKLKSGLELNRNQSTGVLSFELDIGQDTSFDHPTVVQVL